LIRVGYKLPILNKDVKNFRMLARRRDDFISGTLLSDLKLYSTGYCLKCLSRAKPRLPKPCAAGRRFGEGRGEG
jgi:hypothetical protein